MPWSEISQLIGLEKSGSIRAALSDLWARLAGGFSDPQVKGAGFTIAVISLCAKMAKADGVALAVEAEAFEQHFSVPHDEMVSVRRIYDLAKQDVLGFDGYAAQVARALKDEPAMRLDVLEALFHVAAADGVLHIAEEAFLRDVARLFEIDEPTYQHTRALFIRDPADPYEVIGAARSDSDTSLKSRYKALVIENHPDRLAGRGVPAAFIALAEAKLAAVNAAWDVIAKERNL